MGIRAAAFHDGDLHMDFPYEGVMFRFEKATGKVFRRFYGQALETEIEQSNTLFAEARMAGRQVTAEEYLRS
ncbi:MAG: hypothetical protein JWN48_762 [Myxococcaceae bacterium]|nr:hypothetical protein [Myxococcaceae bacterium]